MRTRSDLIISEGAERVTLVRTLIEVVRVEVERRRARDELIAAGATNLERADVREERAGRRGRRTALPAH